MKDVGVFDIMGPIMIGPSSSHTAGAARLGKIARAVSEGDIKEVKFLLHGSFGKTYKGHGTDRALVAGILGMEPSDIRLRDAIDIAEAQGIKVSFEEFDLGDAHPNTVKILITGKTGNNYEVIGSSIGGGSIQVSEVNGNNVEFTGAYPTLIISHMDIPGAVSKVTAILYKDDINIAFMKVFRSQKGKEATMVFEVDHSMPKEMIEEIKQIDSIKKVIMINPAKDGE
ncbi:L-serine ammonia-lyase, iron-sulfur-dependent subunit beta [Clostridium chauvoei]|uniref:L-serine deaminase n=1 Tax=Clostridium chauvoei JF4335 TaxID=1351755 RepID=S6EMY6_9CLOT|nr:L-serine ammonia-lyase, iron-sulfur-dependent subunit beta [Clostridium chauvoei]ATD55831.1 L-serine dehydratase, iron-sulfur-dependent subunit beta [Clostridium chauvoei]ATD56495.1 L-serine dehydratase, iron-sulfur-dependent subunit beta [Clostridium chauvoei]MBX7280189.1 L-serine ammonia-lyase, iron-sulfur-dependent subunit beta [Clostridium chauvoei]MBX7282701.1 L-serine ammonia-lyase, iron-sulfur-dependent subunit beta [Clostridium chauvoei]MBX7285080.1 L-serine ammonia-lyase, iron-sulf